MPLFTLVPWKICRPHQERLFSERSSFGMYDLLIVVVALVTFVALAGFVYFCERI